jgi:hypothetical protein
MKDAAAPSNGVAMTTELTSGAGARLFEVLYVGKVHVSSKKAPPTFIDEAVSKFVEYETNQSRPKSHSLNEQDYHLMQPLSSPVAVTQSCESLETAGRISPPRENLMCRSATEAATLKQSQKNRTMLLQIGSTDVCLISPDRKSIIFDRKFKDISFCSQVLFPLY